MPQITDPILLAIVEGTSTGNLPLVVAKAIHHTAHLLLAAHDLNDVSVFANPEPTSERRFIIPIVGKWGLNFGLSSTGPDDLRLEKLAKSCPKKPSRSSRRPRRAKS